MRLIREMLDASRQTLLLVPEIGLTPQLIGRLTERFGADVAVLHSGLSPTERLDAWRSANTVEAKLVVGTRSAIFASMPSLGLIIVDEEHDSSFKQQTGFRYSARDLAVVRAQKLGAKVVLGSATPSLESYLNAQRNRYQLLELPDRIGGAGTPTVRVIDLNEHVSDHSLSTPLIDAIGRHLAHDRQVILFLNRRGFAPALFCPSCQRAEECDRCDARLTVHAREGRLRCHHCGKEWRLQWRCEHCGTERVGVGAGTQRVDTKLNALFPGYQIARLDRDATSRRGALDAILSKFASGDAKLLVGTQMLTKGHDFPNVTLVGILNADQGLFGTDFRSEERLAQTIVQVAGRAGRRDEVGEVLIQTHYPGHPLLRRLIERGYTAFAELALAERRAAGWPPFAHIAVVRADSKDREALYKLLSRIAALIKEIDSGLAVLGPAANLVERVQGRYGAHVVMKSESRACLHAALEKLNARLRGMKAHGPVRWAIDVDPIEV
jgi:primosomal protein N' (replication factor Y)